MLGCHPATRRTHGATVSKISVRSGAGWLGSRGHAQDRRAGITKRGSAGTDHGGRAGGTYGRRAVTTGWRRIVRSLSGAVRRPSLR